MLSSDLRDKVLQFVESSITVSQLEEWLVPRLLFFLRSPDTADANFIAAIELGLAEMGSGIKTKNEFCGLLKKVLRENNAIAASYPANLLQCIESGSANRTEITGYPVLSSGILFRVT